MKQISADMFLVSETDEKGIITFANDDFCRVAGYGVEELIGKNHNIVRHPDMPKAAFRELWRTLHAGGIWNGFVKNKTKDGDYYWVYATIFPLKDGATTRYISCRKAAHSFEIDAATQLYRTIK